MWQIFFQTDMCNSVIIFKLSFSAQNINKLGWVIFTCKLQYVTFIFKNNQP